MTSSKALKIDMAGVYGYDSDIWSLNAGIGVLCLFSINKTKIEGQ